MVKLFQILLGIKPHIHTSDIVNKWGETHLTIKITCPNNRNAKNCITKSLLILLTSPLKLMNLYKINYPNNKASPSLKVGEFVGEVTTKTKSPIKSRISPPPSFGGSYTILGMEERSWDMLSVILLYSYSSICRIRTCYMFCLLSNLTLYVVSLVTILRVETLWSLSFGLMSPTLCAKKTFQAIGLCLADARET